MAARARSRFDRDDLRPQNDVYTGLLAISLIAMIISCAFLYLDYSQYGTSKAPAVTVPQPQTRPLSTGQLPPPAPLEERPFTKTETADTQPVKPASAVDAPVPAPVVNAVGVEPGDPRAGTPPAAVVEPPAPVPVPAAQVPTPAPVGEVPPPLPTPVTDVPPPSPAPVPVLPSQPHASTPPAPVPPPPAAEASPPSGQPSDPPPLPKSIRQLPQ
jgi:hypothetical protein